MSSKDADEEDFIGEYYNLEDFLNALNEFLANPPEQKSTITRK